MTDSIRSHTQSRRGVLASILMGIGVAAGYGLGLVHFFRYLVPLRRADRRMPMFVGTLGTIPVGSSLTIKDPRGQQINIVRTSDDAEHPEQGFRALSSVCPHLGCQVRWEAAKSRFHCPCHDGAFDKEGIAQSGPPAKEGKNLTTYDVQVDRRNGWVMVMVTPESVYGV